MRTVLLGMGLIVTTVGQSPSDFPAFWRRQCTENEIAQIHPNWKNRQFIQKVRKYMYSIGGTNQKYATVFQGDCCSLEYLTGQTNGISRHVNDALCEIPRELDGEVGGYVPIRQTYYKVSSIQLGGRCVLKNNCKGSVFYGGVHKLLRSNLLQLSQTEQGVKEYYGCMKFIKTTIDYNQYDYSCHNELS